jgi:hypothetical protein
LDIYFILRLFKISYDKNNKKYKSLLSIAYFGDYHVKNLYNFFIDSFYEKVYINNNNNSNIFRCIKIDRIINLDEIILEINDEYNNNEENIKTKYEENIKTKYEENIKTNNEENIKTNNEENIKTKYKENIKTKYKENIKTNPKKI